MAKIASRLSLPELREDNVVREHCLRRLAQLPSAPIIALIAGPGSGKSTLLRQMYDAIDEAGVNKIWIGLDDEEYIYDDVWNVLTDHFNNNAEQGSVRTDLTAESRRIDPKQRAIALCALIAQNDYPAAIFIDDFQFLSDELGHPFFTNLFKYQPDNLQVYFASRLYPEIGLCRLKAQNRLLEFTWEDLSFSLSEAGQFFSGRGKETVCKQVAEELHNLTGGWAVGLQLARMQSRLDREISHDGSVSYDSQDIEEYFESEILSELSVSTINFLMSTSVLDRFDDGLAGHVAGISQTEAAACFRYLHDHGFPITRLGGGGDWKRYHALIRDTLCSIRNRNQPGSEASLLAKASDWWEDNGSILDAIEYAIRGKDYERASLLVESHALELFSYGAAPELARWLRRIPSKIIVRRPQLPLLLCLMLLHTQEPIEVVKLHYDRAEQTIATLEAIDYLDSQTEVTSLIAELEVADTLRKFIAGDMSSVISAADEFLSKDNGARPIFVAVLHNIAGYAHFAIGQNDRARAALSKGKQLHLSVDCVFGVVFSEAFLGMVDYAEGRTASALNHFRTGLQYASSELGENAPTTSTAQLYLYQLDYETANCDWDMDELAETLSNCRHCSHPEIYASGLLIHSEMCLKRGLAEEGKARLDEVLQFGQECGNDLICLEVLYTALQLEIDKGDVAAATGIFAQAQSLWQDIGIDPEEHWDRKFFWRDLFTADILLLTAQPTKAAETYQQLLAQTSLGGRVRRKILVLTKYATSLASKGEEKEAMEHLYEALILAKQSRIVRPILNAGARAQRLMELCYAQVEELEMRTFLEGVFGLSNDTLKKTSQLSPDANTLVIEELTDREIEILKLLTTGAKNREICVALDLAENTVKWYLKRIYEKLCVNNRTEAALVARSMFSWVSTA